jgi:hypothetical protein
MSCSYRLPQQLTRSRPNSHQTPTRGLLGFLHPKMVTPYLPFACRPEELIRTYRAFWKDCVAKSKKGHFSFWLGKIHVVGVSGAQPARSFSITITSTLCAELLLLAMDLTLSLLLRSSTPTIKTAEATSSVGWLTCKHRSSWPNICPV